MKIKVKKILLFISIILIIPSCATKQSFLKSQVNNDSNILVISGFSNEFNVKVIGTTAFTNHMTSFKSIDLDVNKVINGVINNQYESRNDVVGNQYKSRKYEIYEGEKTLISQKGIGIPILDLALININKTSLNSDSNTTVGILF